MSENKEKKKPFRAQYQEYGLTYSRCPFEREVLVEELVKLLDKRGLSMENFYVARETHKEEAKDGKVDTMFHLHIWFKLTSKPNFKKHDCFDITIDGHMYHPNIGKKKMNWIYNYLKKQDATPYTDIASGYIELAKSGNYQGALDLFSQQHPKEYIINMDRIHESFAKLARPPTEMKIYPFTGEPVELEEGKSLLVIGKPGVGKTEWAKSFITHHLKKSFLFVTHIDRLKRYNGEQVILYDDCEFKHLPRTTQIHIAETVNPRDIHCRHACASIPAGVLNVFCANEDPFTTTDQAINRRLQRAPSIRFY